MAGDVTRARKYYERALETEPTAGVAIDFARFLELRGELDRAEAAFRRAIELAPNDAYPVRQYARFLEETLGDLDAAESQYLRAVTLGPSDALTLAWFARFLERHRNDDLRAAHYHLRAARAEPDRARRWADVVRFLLARGLVDEALGSLRRWLERASADDDDAPLAEAYFYGLVYLPEAERKPCFEKLKALLADEGAPVGRWDPDPHVAWVKKAGRPDAPWIERLAARLRERMR
jgi:tetratricopeptide (TPR) repeat protein